MCKFALMLSCALSFAMFLYGCDVSDVQEHSSDQKDVAAEKTSPKNYYFLYDVKSTWHVKIRVNNVLVMETDIGLGSMPIHSFVIDGENTFEVDAEQLGAEVPLPLSIQLRWIRDEENQEEATFEFEPKEVGYKVNKKYIFQGSSAAKWHWYSTPEIDELTEQDKQVMWNILDAYRKAIAEGDIDRINDITRIATGDVARHLGKSEKEMEETNKRERDFLEKICPRIKKIEIRKLAEMEIINCGTVVVVKGPLNPGVFGVPWLIRAVYSDDDGKEQELKYRRFGFSKIDGKWKIVLMW